MNQIDLIRAEIERRKKENLEDSTPYGHGAFIEDKAILSFLDTLKEQQDVELETEIEKFLDESGAPYVWCNDEEQKEWCGIIAKHFYELGRQSKPKVCEGLEEEIERYIPTSLAVKFPTTDIETIKSDIRYIARHFAQWGAEHLKK